MKKTKINEKEWEESFDADYNLEDMNEWILGILVAMSVHTRLYKGYNDSSFINRKLKKLIGLELDKAMEEGRRNMYWHCHRILVPSTTGSEYEKHKEVLDYLAKEMEYLKP